MKRHFFLSTILSTLTLSVTHPGLAEAADAAVSTAALSTRVDEVIVTAERRSEDVKKVPAGISVLGGVALQERQITNLEDISRAVPGVSFGSGGGPGLDNIEMRGVSSTSGSATVGIYLDDVSLTSKNLKNGAVGAIEPKLFDMDRVEMLRGPQGTLYGASSEGGAIRFISNQPDLNNFSLTLGSEGSVTSHGGANFEDQFVVNQPLLGGRGAIRFGIDAGELSGWIDNLGCCGTHIPGASVTNAPAGQVVNKNVNDERWLVAKLSGKFEIDDTLSVTPSIFAEWDNTSDTSVYYPTVGLYQQEKEVPEPIDNRFIVGSLNINKDFGFAQLSSITSYFQQDLYRNNDGTYDNSEYFSGEVIAPYYPNNPDTYQIGQLPSPTPTWTRTSSVSQEIRLASNTSTGGQDKFSWVAGMYFSDFNIQNNLNAYVQNFVPTFTRIYGVSPANSLVPDFRGQSFSLPGQPNGSIIYTTAHTHEEQYAAFGDVTYSLKPNLKLTAGVRYSYAPGSYVQNQIGFFAQGVPPVVSETTNFTSVTPKFSVLYEANDDVSLYATVGQGNRLGGGNAFIPPTACDRDLRSLGYTSAPTSYKSDSLWSYEGGLKGKFLDKKLSVNADVYYLEWTDLQQKISLPVCGSSLIANVGNAVSYGPELELTYRPISGLTFGLTYSYSHAAISQIRTKDFSLGIAVGDSVLFVPEWMASFRAQYNRDLTSDISGFVRADYNFTGPSHGSFKHTAPGYSQPEYSVMNASIGASHGRYEVSIFAKNLLNNSQKIQVPVLQALAEAYTLRPLTAGARLKAKF